MISLAGMTKNKFALLIALLAVAFFAILRLSNLNVIPVFVDEAIYVRWSQVMRAESTLRFLPLSDGKQPLFMWLTIPALKYISDPLIAGRIISVVAGVFSLAGIGILGYLLFDSFLVGAFSSLLYSILPFAVFFDRMALADSLLSTFGIWTIIFAIKFARSARLDQAMILGFILGGGLITKSPGLIFYLWVILAIIFFGKHSRASFWSYLKGFAAVVIISQMIYSVLRLGPGFSMIGARNLDYVFSWGEVLSHPLNPFVANFKNTIYWIWLLFTPPVILASLITLIHHKSKRTLLFLILISHLPLVAQAAIAKVYTTRYILYAVIPLIPFYAWGIQWLFVRKGIMVRILAIICVLSPLVLSFGYIYKPENSLMTFDMRNGYLEEWTAGQGQREIAQYLINLESQGSKIVVFTEGYFGTLPDGLQIYTEGHRNITIVGSPPNITSIPTGLLQTSADNKRFFVMNKSRNHLSEGDLKKLTLIKEYPKAVRLDGSQEFLQFFQY